MYLINLFYFLGYGKGKLPLPVAEFITTAYFFVFVTKFPQTVYKLCTDLVSKNKEPFRVCKLFVKT